MAKTCTVRDLSGEPLEVVSRMLAAHFRAEPWKIGMWLMTKNPFLGDNAPAEMMTNGRGEKLVQWMKQVLSGELP